MRTQRLDITMRGRSPFGYRDAKFDGNSRTVRRAVALNGK